MEGMRVGKGNAPYGCPMEVTLDVIGGKWKGIILGLLAEKPRRFTELRRELPEITQRILTLQLRELEADGIISRTMYQEIPPRVEYALTDFGRTLKPILLAMHEWGDRYGSEVIERKHGRHAPPACDFASFLKE
jgi:DNA-binding HxlR family transcriptional regulator